MTMLHVVTFADSGTKVWGVSLTADADPMTRLAMQTGPASAVIDAALTPPQPGEEGRLTAHGVALTITPSGPALYGHDVEGTLETRDEPCQVSGLARIDGEDTEIRSLGWRSSAQTGEELSGLDSLRFLAAWLSPQAGFSLLALRPGRAEGHEMDVVAAVLLDEPPVPPVAEPRLSTTYTDQGLPARAGLELWFSEVDEDDPDADAVPWYPRRAAGEATGAALNWSQAGLELRASLMRWHSHGLEGSGVYVLGQHR